MAALNGLVGAIALFLGRSLFWFFVSAAGFVLGFRLATQFLDSEQRLLVLVIAFGAGVLGALLAVFAQRLAVGIAGFIAGGTLLTTLAAYVGLDGESLFAGTNLVLYLLGGLVGAGLVGALFDPALIVLSAALGASLLARAATTLLSQPSGLVGALIFIVLWVMGVAVQWRIWRGEEAGVGDDRR